MKFAFIVIVEGIIPVAIKREGIDDDPRDFLQALFFFRKIPLETIRPRLVPVQEEKVVLPGFDFQRRESLFEGKKRQILFRGQKNRPSRAARSEGERQAFVLDEIFERAFARRRPIGQNEAVFHFTLRGYPLPRSLRWFLPSPLRSRRDEARRSPLPRAFPRRERALFYR